MGLFSRILKGQLRRDEAHRTTKRTASGAKKAKHVCQFEQVEQRLLLAADIHFGAVYFEEATGDDSAGDRIEITFEGGAEGTELTQIVLDGDKLADGAVDLGDIFFDIEAGGNGAFNAFGMDIEPPSGFTIDNVTVVDGSSLLVFDLSGFTAGDKLVFSVDVDEMGLFNATALAEGGEFEGTRLTGYFNAEHYQATEGTAIFFDAYDATFDNVAAQTGSTLDLPPDNYMPPHEADRSDRTAGAVLPIEQTPLPITISGSVFEDFNADNDQDPGDLGIANVDLELLRQEDGVYVSTGLTTTTDANGDYLFDDPSIIPGTYRVVETQPAGFTSVGAQEGTINGTLVGSVVTADIISEIVIDGGEDSIDNDFAEVRPGSISGQVHLDNDGDCILDPEDETLEGVVIHLLDAEGAIIETTQTDADGRYQFSNLLPGTYGVHEVQPTGVLDGDEHVGSAGGLISSDDTITQITLLSGTAGVEYDFCEHPPAQISGYVYHDRDNDGLKESGEEGIEGVTLKLLDADGNETGLTTTTNAAGYYEFTNLAPGEYSVCEVHPEDWIDGLDTAGTAGGTATNPGDQIDAIPLEFNTNARQYNFGELKPGSIRGLVHSDLNMNCILESGEQPLENVVIDLLDADGNIIATTLTDANGLYEFEGLPPGTYGVREHQPDGFLHGGQKVGSGGGVVAGDDHITNINLLSGDDLIEYDFCEHPPGSISGYVHADTDGDCVIDPEEQRLEGVVVELLDAEGNVLATTTTDVNGFYKFEGLAPGEYAVRETQPDGFFHGGQSVGSGGGIVAGDDLLTSIDVNPGNELVHYDFCEVPAASISGYVFQDGETIITADGRVPADLASIRDGQLTSDDTRIAGVTLELRNGITGEPILGSSALPGTYAANQPVTTTTDENGYYEFHGLRAGNYAVFEVHPNNYHDSLDTAGTLGGIAINPSDTINPLVLSTLTTDPADDAILRIALFPSQNSTQNNFSEVLVDRNPPPPEDPRDPFTPPLNPAPLVPIELQPIEVLLPVYERIEDFGGSSSVKWYTWHLSVLNGGHPRAFHELGTLDGDVMDVANFSDFQLRDAVWTINNEAGERTEIVFGNEQAIPITGDFNGDGTSEVGVYINGTWLIDVNGNGVWDSEDLWAKLGTGEDLPVTGDWDGDGKTDIGIFGPAWAGDPRAVELDPGIPDPDNPQFGIAKNVPPEDDDAAIGHRKLQLTDSGTPRADVIDHVFAFGVPGEYPVAGDWNGDGIDTIAVYRNGQWHLDADGDGRWDVADINVDLGEHGAKPIVGDWDGDGIDNLGVFADGRFYLDMNGNQEHDEVDLVFEMGNADSEPVVGDWDGDGRDEVGVFQKGAAHQQARSDVR